jgi:O-antigen ligase/polysaccharide polymerase Wzy-like membrane protein
MVRESGAETGERSPPLTGGRRTVAVTPPAEAAGAGGSTLLMLFVASLFIPGRFPVGPIWLSFYSLFLLIAIIPLALHWVRGKAGPIVAADILVLLFCLWQALSVVAIHGVGRIFFVGSVFVEAAGAYLVGRTLVRSAADYRAFFRYFLVCLAVLLPFVLIELVLGRRLLSELLGHVLSTDDIKSERRLGLMRVALSFPHPILFGFVCSLAVANAYYLYESWRKRMQATGFVLFMVFASLSSGPMLSALLQLVMVGWDRIVRFLRGHWVLFVLLGAVTLAVLQLVLPGGLIGYMIDEVIFNPIGGANRVAILQYGTAEILRHPVLGIGLNEWTRPWWQAATVDNFWLLTAMRFGIPALLFLALAITASGLRIMSVVGLSGEERRYRTGYMISLVGAVVVLGTVHIWEAPVVFFMAYIGAGVWFYTGRSAAAAALRPARRRAEAGRAAARPDRVRARNADAAAARRLRGRPVRRSGRAGADR